jgi:hypothetical protein
MLSAALVASVLSIVLVLVVRRYEFVGLRPYRCSYASGSIPMDEMAAVGLDPRVSIAGVDAPSGALAEVELGDHHYVAAHLLRRRKNLGIAVWKQDRHNTHTQAINALARKWSRVDAPSGEDGGTAARVVARCLADDKYP